MRTRLFSRALVVAVLGAALTTTLATPATAGTAAEVPSYPEWVADVTEVADEAEAYLEQRLPAEGEQVAIVLDIDNTSLETHYNFDLFNTPAVRPVLELARQAKADGAAVYFITGRPGIGEWITRGNLDRVGYRYDGLYQTGLTDLLDLQRYKTARRAELEAKGYTIVANIGNNDSDLNGGHAERTFKLPDYDGALS